MISLAIFQSASNFLEFLTNYGYVGLFLVSLLGTSSIVFSASYYALLFSMAATPVFNPIIIIIISSIGAALGNFASYFVGYGARKKILNSKYVRFFEFAQKWFKSNGFLTVFFFALTPLPDEIIGFTAGSTKYRKRMYFLAVLCGKLIQTSLIVLGGRYSYDVLFSSVF